ncbi:hypothetical protein ACIBBB_32900 [Streptomyces sp. NPDC051217]|uniref:hypothetical protein n=1 Tax=Streptomyces sp. NPDC051217 TaxID=3365644 RepID=UPI0037B6D47B
MMRTAAAAITGIVAAISLTAATPSAALDSDEPPAFVVDVLLGTGHIEVRDGVKQVGFDISILCRAQTDMEILMQVSQESTGAEGFDQRLFSCTEINTQFLQTYFLSDERWASGTAHVQATLLEQGTAFDEFQRDISLIDRS